MTTSAHPRAWEHTAPHQRRLSRRRFIPFDRGLVTEDFEQATAAPPRGKPRTPAVVTLPVPASIEPRQPHGENPGHSLLLSGSFLSGRRLASAGSQPRLCLPKVSPIVLTCSGIRILRESPDETRYRSLTQRLPQLGITRRAWLSGADHGAERGRGRSSALLCLSRARAGRSGPELCSRSCAGCPSTTRQRENISGHVKKYLYRRQGVGADTCPASSAIPRSVYVSPADALPSRSPGARHRSDGACRAVDDVGHRPAKRSPCSLSLSPLR